MIINTKESFISYNVDRPFDLMNAPLNTRLNFIYNNFINNVLCIYGDQKNNGSIPVFWTKSIPSTTRRIADESSTLRELIPGKTYYVRLLNEDKTPLEIPHYITSEEFLHDNSIANSDVTDINYCYGQPVIGGDDHRNIYLTKASGYSTDIDITVNNLYPNTLYSYYIANEYSNWPAKLSVMSGTLERSTISNNIGYTSGTLKSVFSYILNGEPTVNSIPYSLIDTSDDSYKKNIFTILKLSLYANDSLLVEDHINIRCDDCFPDIKPPIVSLSNEENSKSNLISLSGINNLSTPIFITYDKLNPEKNYNINFTSENANWPAFIGPKSINNIKPQIIYNLSGVNYGSGSIETIFRFSPISNPTNTWSNLPYTLDSFYDEKFIRQNIYNTLKVTLTEDNNVSYSDSVVIRGINNLPTDLDCMDTLVIKYQNTNLSYPILTSENRPGSEINIDKTCCSKDQILNVTINSECCNHSYRYYFYPSDPLVSIIPLSGTVSLGENQGRVSAIYNLNGRPGATVRFRLQEILTNNFVTDDIIIRCKDTLV